MNAKVATEVKKHFRVADGTISLTGAAKKWFLIACNEAITGYATTLRAHLLASPEHGIFACPNISKETKNAIRADKEENPQQYKEGTSSQFWSL
jgi:hypothetical protein